VLLLIYGEEFQNHSDFAHWQRTRIVKVRAGNKFTEVKEPWDRWEVRKEIKKKLRQSLVSLAQ
jgi:hypothetical protein